MVTVTAPAGYGKSTLMAQWQVALQRQGIMTGWLNLDEDDNDATRFLRYLSAALAQAGVQTRAEAAAAVQDPGMSGGTQAALELLAADLGELEHRIVLFIDDLHFLHAPDVIAILRWLVSYAPDQVAFVLGSRASVPLPLGRLRVRRKLLEFDVEDLRFSAGEANGLMVARLGESLDDVQVTQLLKRTQGWPAGLELAALILDGCEDRQQVVAAFAGNDRNVMDYLGEVLLDNLEGETRDFIFRIAQFNRVDKVVAAAASERDDAGRLLEALHARNLFLKRLDREGRWFRFHHLVGQFFREQGLQQMPEACEAALLRGADALRDNGMPLEAIHCALRARAWQKAAQWLAEHAEELVFRRGYTRSMLDVAGRLPEAWSDRHPDILLNTAFAAMLTGRVEQSQALLARLHGIRQQRAQAGDMSAEALASLDCAIGMQEAHAAGVADQMEESMRAASEWMDRWPEVNERDRGSVANILAFAHKCRGEVDEGLAVISRGRDLLQSVDAPYVLSWNHAVECLLHLKRGNYDAAERAALTLLEYVEAQLSAQPQHARHAQTVLAFVRYERGQFDKAREHIESIPENGEFSQADYLILHHLTRARLLREGGDFGSGMECLLSGCGLAERNRLHRASLTLRTEQITWLCRSQRLDEARELAHRLGLDRWPGVDEGFSLQADKASRVCARLRMSTEPGTVAERLDAFAEHSRKLGLWHRYAEWRVLQALARDAAGDTPAALRCLADALLTGARYGYQRLFLDEGEALQSLLRKIRLGRDEQAAARLLQTLLKDAAGAGADADTPDQSSLVEELTKRELQIVQRLPSDLTNREIAESIFISEGTLKWHLHRIYGKLEVKNRAGALTRAMELGLLQA